MTANPKTPAPLLKNSAAAPMIYFDGAPAFGVLNGVVEIELSARVLMPKSDGSAGVDVVCVAHLRASVAAVEALKQALERALEMLMKQEAERRSVPNPSGYELKH